MRIGRNALLRGALGIAISLFAIWVLVRLGRLRRGVRGPADGVAGLDRGDARHDDDRHRRARGPLAGAARADRAAAVPARPRLHLHRLPRQQRPAGAARRAVPEPCPRRGRGRQPADGPRDGRRRAGRRHGHGRRDRRARGPRPERPRRDDAARSCSGVAFVALLVIVLGLGIAAHRLPGAERVAADHRAAAAPARAGPPAARWAWRWPVARGSWPSRSSSARRLGRLDRRRSSRPARRSASS